MEPPKFRIKKVGEEMPTNTGISAEKSETSDHLSTLESLNESTTNEASVLEKKQELKCINCEQELEFNTIICMNCGTNQQSGKELNTKIKKKKKKKVKIVTDKKRLINLDSWALNLIIFGILAYPTNGIINININKQKSLKEKYDKCVENLKQFHTKPKKQSSHVCYSSSGKNFQLYKATTKDEFKSPNFVKAYCSDHKHGVNNKGDIEEVKYPVGKKVNTPSKFRRNQKDNDTYNIAYALIVWGFALNLTARISFCYYSIKQGLPTFICCMLIPFYNILFWLRNREQVGPSFICGIVSSLLIVSGAITIIPYILK